MELHSWSGGGREREKWMVFKAAHNLAFVFIFGSSHTDAIAVFDSIQSISTLYCSNKNRFSSVFKYGHRLRGWRNRNNFVCAVEKLSQRIPLIMPSGCNRTTFGIKNQLNFVESCNRWDSEVWKVKTNQKFFRNFSSRLPATFRSSVIETFSIHLRKNLRLYESLENSNVWKNPLQKCSMKWSPKYSCFASPLDLKHFFFVEARKYFKNYRNFP